MKADYVEAMKLALEALDHNSLFTSLMPGYDGRIIEKAYKAINKALAEQPAQRKPLADEEIKELYGDDDNFRMTKKYVVAFARAIEAAHNIKENT